MRRSGSIAIAVAVLAVALSAPCAEESAPPGPRTARLEGTASLDRHHPVVGVAVLVRAGQANPRFWLTTTDDRGFFFLDRLPEGTYRVELDRGGLAPVVKDGIDVRFPFRAVVEVKLAPAPAGSAAPRSAAVASGKNVRLSGIVSVRGAGPLPEARIQLIRTDENENPRSALTLPDGSFTIEDLPGGSWRLEVLGAGYLPLRADLRLEDDASVEATLVAQPANYVAPALDLLPLEEPIPPPVE